MAKSGFGLNIIGIVVTVVVTYLLVLPMFGVVIDELPAWVQNIPK
jgi:sodium-dependent dicarboxylate transporter 2/3/5